MDYSMGYSVVSLSGGDANFVMLKLNRGEAVKGLGSFGFIEGCDDFLDLEFEVPGANDDIVIVSFLHSTMKRWRKHSIKLDEMGKLKGEAQLSHLL
jgi:hypothetical protein